MKLAKSRSSHTDLQKMCKPYGVLSCHEFTGGKLLYKLYMFPLHSTWHMFSNPASHEREYHVKYTLVRGK